MRLSTVKILQEIIDKDSSIELIEIWERVLYIRRKEGRCTFHSKKGIQETEGIYINIVRFDKNEYKRLQFKYHPDREPKHLHISKGINQWKDILFRYFKGEFNRNIYNTVVTSYSQDTSIFIVIKSASNWRIQKTRFQHRPRGSQNETWTEAEIKRRWQENLDWQCGRIKEDKDYGPDYPW